MPSWLVALVLSIFIGSFLGVLIRRLPVRAPVILDRSRCETCHYELGVRDLVPILSYLLARGRCRSCGATIAPFHLAIELAAMMVAISAALASPDANTLWCGCALGWTLLALAWIDWTHMILPDALTLPLILMGLAATAWLNPNALTNHAVATALSYLLFRCVGGGYRWLRGRDGLGEGDSKLMAAAGAWVGIASLSSVLLGGGLVTLVVALANGMWRPGRLSRTSKLPFGPGLCVALWLVWLLAGV